MKLNDIMNMDHRHHMNHSMMDMDHSMMDIDQSMMDMNHSMMGTNHSMMDIDHSMMNHSMTGMNHTMRHGHHAAGVTNHTLHHAIGHISDHDIYAEDGHNMYFTFGFPRVIVLQGWTVISTTELVISLLGLCIIAIFLESLARLTKRATSKTLCHMAKKNLKGFHKLLQDPPNNNETPTTKPDQFPQKQQGDPASKVDTGNNAQVDAPRGMSQGMMKRTLSVDLGMKWDQTGAASKRVESIVQLTFPQCFQYRLLLTILHVIQALLAYFLMLALMTYNWWVFIVILAGSVLGFLLFGQGTHFNALENMTYSALPPDFAPGSSLHAIDSADVASCSRTDAEPASCHGSAVSKTDPEGSHEVSPLQNDVESREGNSEKLEHVESSTDGDLPPPVISDGVRKVDIRIDLQGDVISDEEFMKRLQTSKESVV